MRWCGCCRRSGFSDPVNAGAFLRDQLPPRLSAQVEWEAMRLEPGSFVDSKFRTSESDLLFSVPIKGRESYLYLLFEHQRAFDGWIGLRLLRYILASGEIDKETFLDRVKTVQDANFQDKAMTLAQQFHREGHQEGRQEGRQEGQIQAKQVDVVDVLEIRFERVPEGLREEIGKITDPVRLKDLHKRAVICASLEEFAGGL